MDWAMSIHCGTESAHDRLPLAFIDVDDASHRAWGELQQRFGPLSAQTIERLEQADADRILTWSLRVLDARSLDEVFAERGE